MPRRNILFIAFFCSIVSLPHTTYAESRDNSGSICIGYNPETGVWGNAGQQNVWRPENPNCPKGHALVSQMHVQRSLFGGPPKKIPVFGACCPLPADALIEKHEFVSDTCPEDHIATGSSADVFTREDYLQLPQAELLIERKNVLEKRNVLLRCTKINTRRYQLSDERSYIYWGWPRHLSKFAEHRIAKTKIPVSARSAIGRLDRTTWKSNGCIGWPLGTFLTSKTAETCSDFKGRTLEYRGASGDPRAGTQVNIFADCATISDRFDKDAYCIPSASSAMKK